MTLQTGQQYNTQTQIRKLPNISRSKGNQATKFNKLRKYSERNIFLQKSCRK